VNEWILDSVWGLKLVQVSEKRESLFVSVLLLLSLVSSLLWFIIIYLRENEELRREKKRVSNVSKNIT
jgi:hypothetical protein